MKLTILGSGTSQGVPTIGCRCEVCRSSDARDIRLRSSAMVEWEGLRIVIDSGPDFRQQMLRAGVRRVDALLLTHEHKDHTGGLDDTRALNFVDYPIVHRLQLYGTAPTLNAMRRDYYYAFTDNKYQGVPEIDLHYLERGETFRVRSEDGLHEVEVVAIDGFHAPQFGVTGYRFGDVAYLTDFKKIADTEVEKLRGLKVLVVNALRWKPHHSHFSVDEALELVRKVSPEQTYFTHLSHDIGLYDEAMAKLPKGVALAYDGLEIEI
ncbi:MAG: MBL fold metallo-hydrolase [Rikenellaceae bacterium]